MREGNEATRLFRRYPTTMRRHWRDFRQGLDLFLTQHCDCRVVSLVRVGDSVAHGSVRWSTVEKWEADSEQDGWGGRGR